MGNQIDIESMFSLRADTEGGRAHREDKLDLAGQSILGLLQKAAGAAEATRRHAIETVQQLSQQLRQAEKRAAELEAELKRRRENCERVAEWLHLLSNEIQERLIRRLEGEDNE
jgi:Skp family chaperone for outer membrane proteins